MFLLHGTFLMFLAMILGLSLKPTSLIRGTSLQSALRWGRCALVVWLIFVVRVWFLDATNRLADLLFWLACVISLCPLVAILGARRGRETAWSWFVILPMILVLAWPALALFLESDADETLTLQIPALLGFVAVVIMGTGNFFGTRFAWPAAVLAAGSALAAMSMSEQRRDFLREAALLCYCGAAFWTWLQIAKLSVEVRRNAKPGVNFAWGVFRSLYGIVWAKRATDRWNLVTPAEAERLGPTGFKLSGESVQALSSASEQRFRNLLNRFVTDAWMAQFWQNTGDSALDPGSQPSNSPADEN